MDRAEIEAALKTATRKYEETEKALQEVREELHRLVILALKSDMRPEETTKLTPWTGTRIRALARDAGIPPFPRGGGKRRPAGGRSSGSR